MCSFECQGFHVKFSITFCLTLAHFNFNGTRYSYLRSHSGHIEPFQPPKRVRAKIQKAKLSAGTKQFSFSNVRYFDFDTTGPCNINKAELSGDSVVWLCTCTKVPFPFVFRCFKTCMYCIGCLDWRREEWRWEEEGEETPGVHDSCQ